MPLMGRQEPQPLPSSSFFTPAMGTAFLNEDPQMAFLTYLLQQNIPTTQQRFLQSRFGDVNNLYRQRLGQQAATGQDPTLSFFGDFLPQFNLNRFRLGFSPQVRGEGRGQFSPRTQFLF